MGAKVYTKTGDKGMTYMPLLKKKVSKGSAFAKAVGDIDELNAHIGLICESKDFFAYTSDRQEEIDFLPKVQHALFSVGAQVSCGTEMIKEEHIVELEKRMDNMDKHLKPLKEFILPRNPAVVHMARSICRRSERSVTDLFDALERASVRGDYGSIEDLRFLNLPIKYLNRLSDYFFVLSRFLSDEETVWDKDWDK